MHRACAISYFYFYHYFNFFTTENFKVKDENVIALVSNLPAVNVSADGNSVTTGLQQVKAIPYYTWCNRGSNPMQVWLPTKFKDVKINN